MAEETDTAWMDGTVLIELEPGPLPIIPKALWAEIQEWMLAWKHADALRDEGLEAPGGLLLHGPTGSGKTSLARGILKYIGDRPGCILEAHNVTRSLMGETESGVVQAFKLSDHQGALLVIEELDALGSAREMNTGGGADNARRNVVICLMRLLEAAQFPVIATTNHKDTIDAALLRRFELQLEVPALDEKGRGIVLRKILGRDPEPELVALPLNESIRIARRLRRREFLMTCEEREKAA